MGLSNLASAAAILALLPSALGVPLNAKRDVPGYCDPGVPYDSNNMVWDDQSAACQAAGIATNCCVTFSGSGICKVSLDSAAVSDLENAVGQQINKDGQFKTTTVGQWTATYGLYIDDQPNSAVLTEWFHSISDFASSSEAQDSVGNIGDIFFSYLADGVASNIHVSASCS